MKLSAAHINLLAKLANGCTLKSHRDIDGNKVYRLHALDGTVESPSPKTVDQLKHGGYIDSNKKFPAATYLLTDRGRKVICAYMPDETTVLSARNYS